jgi:hypothetical protein
VKSRELEEFLSTESGIFGEVTARLQRLRDARLLPEARGAVEPRLQADEVASSILSMVAGRVQAAGEVTLGLRVLKPYGGVGQAFGGAPGFAQALVMILDNQAARDVLIDVRCSDADPSKRIPTLSSITYTQGGIVTTTYYLPGNLLATIDQTVAFDRNQFGHMINREVYFSPRLFNRLGQRLGTETRWRAPAKGEQL